MVDLVGGLFVLLVRAQKRGIRCQRLFGVNYHLKRFIFDLDSSHAVRGGIATGGNDESNLLHLKMDTIQCEHCLGVPREGGHPGQSSGIQVFPRYHCYHTGYLHCRTTINTLDKRVGIGATHNIAVEHPFQLYIIDIVALTTNKARIFLTFVRFAQAMFKRFSRHD